MLCAARTKQVLCPDLDADEEGVWMSDELETCAFASLGDMRVVSGEKKKICPPFASLLGNEVSATAMLVLVATRPRREREFVLRSLYLVLVFK